MSEETRSLVLGIDVGTTGTKTVAMSRGGGVVASAYRAYPMLWPGPGRAEQRAEDWWETLVRVVRETVAAAGPGWRVEALALSAQGGSTVPLDGRGQALRTAIAWMDTRAGEQVERFLALHDAQSYYRRCGARPNPMMTAAHLAWLREREPAVFREAARFATTPDYLNLRLTGRLVIDHTAAGMTGMHNLLTGDWDASMLDIIGVRVERLAEVRPAGEELGTLTAEAAAALGLPRTVRVFNGGHDQYCAAVGCGAVLPGEFMLSAGTAWVLLGTFAQPVWDDGGLWPGRHVAPGLYGAFRSISVGGAAMRWYQEHFGLAGQSLAEVDALAEERVTKNAHTYCVPYVAGTNELGGTGRACGAFAGLSLDSDRYDMALTVMEGVAFEAAMALDSFRQGGGPKQLRMVGGGAKGELWPRILAAATGLPVLRPGITEAAGVGAAVIAAVGLGWYPDYARAAGECGTERRMEPDPQWREHYQEKLARYRARIPQAQAFRRDEERESGGRG